MKAKEYAKTFLEKPLTTHEELLQAAYEVMVDFLTEGEKLARSRNVTTDAGLISVLKEQCTKWRAFANIVNKKFDGELELIRDDGLKLYLLDKMPELKGKL